MISADRRQQSATATCIAAARATEAVNLWVAKLDLHDRDAVRRKLEVRQDWNALAIFNRSVDVTKER